MSSCPLSAEDQRDLIFNYRLTYLPSKRLNKTDQFGLLGVNEPLNQQLFFYSGAAASPGPIKECCKVARNEQFVLHMDVTAFVFLLLMFTGEDQVWYWLGGRRLSRNVMPLFDKCPKVGHWLSL